MRFAEHDVSRDRAAASEMVRISQQTGVPVIVVDGQFVVGFDRPRLEMLLAQAQRESADGVRRPSLGLSVADSRPGSGRPSGAYVGLVRPGSPAARAGVREGDVVTEVGGAPISGAADLEKALSAYSPGQEVMATVVRAGQPLRLRVVLA